MSVLRLDFHEATRQQANTQVLPSLSAVSANTWYEVNLTSHITADGKYSLRISDPQGEADYSSKEGTNAPNETGWFAREL